MGSISPSTLIMGAALLVLFHGTCVARTDIFTCFQSCTWNTILMKSISYQTRSLIECAIRCSKTKLCKTYMFLNNNLKGSNPAVTTKQCRLYKSDNVKCSQTIISLSEEHVCRRVIAKEITVPLVCSSFSQRVLNVIHSKPIISKDLEYLRNLLANERSLKIKFVIKNSNYVVRANYVTLGASKSGTLCASILDSMTYPISLGFVHRAFCTDGSQTANPPALDMADQFYLDVQITQGTWPVDTGKVFTTGGDSFNLVTALNNGFGIKLLFSENNIIADTDVIIYSLKTTEITSQSRLYENGKLRMVSQSATGLRNVVTWALGSSLSSDPVLENTQAIWFAETCWKLVTSSNSVMSTTALRNAVESGHRVRVRIVLDNLVVLGNADFLSVQSSSGEIIAYVLMVLVHKSNFPGGILSAVDTLIGHLLDGPPQDKPQWAHFMITSSGEVTTYITSVGDQEYKETSRIATVQWFVDVSNWTLVHTSNSVSTKSLTRLVAHILNGSDVRVNVQTGGRTNWFVCDMLDVTDNNDQDVKCHVSGEVSLGTVTYNGALLNLFSTTKKAIRSVCFIVTASNGHTSSHSSCLWYANGSETADVQPQRVEWFVSI